MAETEAPEPNYAELESLGQQYVREVNSTLENTYNGDITDPGWFEYCRGLDEFKGITHEEPEDPA